MIPRNRSILPIWPSHTSRSTRGICRRISIGTEGGFLPKPDWREQPAEVVTRIQVIDRQGRPRKRSECDGVLWPERWGGSPYVVYGHTPRMDVHETPTSMCIDTACVMG